MNIQNELNRMNEITPVLLAGGSGTRLWPLSRKSYPKQFSAVVGNRSLFQESALRMVSSEILNFCPPIAVTNFDFRFVIGEQLQELNIKPGSILIEPSGKNTAPAIMAACYHAFRKNKEAILLVAPSDHIIKDVEAFHEAVSIGLDELNKNKIITFGISPTHVETGYGYLEVSELSARDPVEIIRFIEKPDRKKSEEMFAKQHFLWNSGIFLFKAIDMINAFKIHAPGILECVKAALDKGEKDLDFFRLDSEAWEGCEDISIDYAIMEKVTNLMAVPFKGGWSDLGSWNAVWQEMDPDNSGLSVSSNAHAIDCKNTLLRAESDSQELVGIGLENIIAVSMPDAVLVADKNKVQEVKRAVLTLKGKNILQSETFPKDFRPWGWFESLALSDRFQVKRICVKPKASLSLQSHHHRSEHWIVVEGTAKVTIGRKVKLISEGESIYVPLGVKHRMENPGKMPMILIEVQTGSYLGEDDIIRYEDIYKRK